MRTLTHIVLHHSATDARLIVGDPDGARLWAAIERNHQARWAGTVPGYTCDYHFGIGPTGLILAGQPLAMVAYNCGNARLNAVSIAVCFLGNFEAIHMPDAQRVAGIQLLQTLCRAHAIPVAHVLLHREVPDEKTGVAGFTACPGRWFPSATIRSALEVHRGGLASRSLATR